MNKFSQSQELNREHSLHGHLLLFAHLLFGGGPFVILAYGIKHYDDDGGLSLGVLWRLATAAALFGYYCYSANAGTGVFDALDLWESSLVRRRDRDQLIRKSRAGQRIFVEGGEAEVFDGHFVPKRAGEVVDCNGGQPPPEQGDQL
jgi:hypothetical protein